MAIEFSERIAAHPRLPGGRRLRADRATLALLASATSRPYPPLPAVRRGDRRARSARLNRYPDPTNARCAARSRERYGVPAVADRDRQRLLRHPARRRRGAARARRRARLRVAVVLVYPHLARGLRRARDRRCRSTTHDRHDLDAMLREITAATRLVIVCNPNNPTATALPLAEIAGVRRRGARATSCVILDEAYCEFNLLEDPDASIDAARRATRTSCCCARSRRSTASAGCASATRCAARRSFRAAVDQVRQPFFCNAPRRPRRSRRSATRTRSPRASSATVAERHRARGRPARAGHRARRVAGQLLLVRPRRGADARGRRMRGPRASAACSCAPAARSGGAGALRVTVRHAGRERALPGRARELL